MFRLPLLLVAAVLIGTCPAPAYATAGPSPEGDLPATLRVRLLEQLSPRSVTVEAPWGGLEAYIVGGNGPSVRIAEGGRVHLELSGADVRLESPDGTIQGSELRLVAPSGEALTLHVGSHVRSYRGEIWAAADTRSLRLVNHVPLEDYVASVVSAEYGLDDVEGSKAMAVVARTYALKALKSADYDQVDHTLSQVYRGTRTVTPLALAAAAATRGEVLTYDGDLIEAVYSSSSGGHTANNEDVWQARAHPYLRGRKDPWDTVSPHHEWRYDVDAARLHALVGRSFGVDAADVTVNERSGDGRVRTLRLAPGNGRDRLLSAQEFRLEVIRAFGATALRSTYFDIRRVGDRYVFEGRGFGHGVGLSQWGAHAMALDGRSYRDILDFYYRDVTLEQRATTDQGVPPGVMAASTGAPAKDPSATHDTPVDLARAALQKAAEERSGTTGWESRRSSPETGSVTRVVRRRLAW